MLSMMIGREGVVLVQETFLQFWTLILNSVSDFLMTEPISYFTALIILTFVVGLFKYIYIDPGTMSRLLGLFDFPVAMSYDEW